MSRSEKAWDSVSDPGGRHPAPEPLSLIQEFVNTLDIKEGREMLEEPQHLYAWLHEHGLLQDRAILTEAELRKAKELREAIRELLLGNNGVVPDPAAMSVLNYAAAEAIVKPHFSNGVDLVSEDPGIAGALVKIIAVMLVSMLRSTWSRLKACQNDQCQWAFHDYSKNRSGRWCAMAVCGNRLKARAYRQRKSLSTD